MTATRVNGLEVIADEPTPSPIAKRDGTAIIWQQTRTLLLEDGSTVYGCLHCDYARPNILSIRPHLNKHKDRSAPSAPAGAAADLSLNELLKKLGDLNKVVAERDEWKRRATKAERSLQSLRNALKAPP
jgi:hypothetical protein